MSRNKCFFLAAASLVAACSAPGGPTEPVQGTGGDSGAQGATGPTGPTGPADSGSNPQPTDSGSGNVPDTSVSTPAVKLPFYLSDQFVPSGFMGDSTASMMAITLTHDAASCKSPRQTGAGGDCYGVTWAPTLTGDAGAAWAGVYWQSSANNWGSKPGKAIAPGATKISFYAAGAAGGETIQLCAGGINSMGTTATLPYGDTFKVQQPAVTLTTTWTQYELPLTGASYTTVIGGFCWVTSTTKSENIKFYIDDVQWE